MQADSFEDSFRAALHAPPPTVTNDRLRHWWHRPVAELAALPPTRLPPEEQERHRLFSLTLASLVYYYFNGNKHGRGGAYPWNEARRPADGPHLDGDYLGHNIAALAVDSDGRVLDFDFNHNALYGSTVQHAEARLVRRLFTLARVQETWVAPVGLVSPSSRAHPPLVDITMYTSLESCAQCSGVMALAQVGRVVYLQTDPGTYWVGRILRNLTDDKLRAPLPIAGSEIGMPSFEQLDNSYSDFVAGVKTRPFYRAGAADGLDDRAPSITSYLCTKAARDIFGAARQELTRLVEVTQELQYPSYRPREEGQCLSNAEALDEAASFLAYATSSGRRGTPHGQ